MYDSSGTRISLELFVTGIAREDTYTIPDGYIVSEISDNNADSLFSQAISYTSNPPTEVVDVKWLYNNRGGSNNEFQLIDASNEWAYVISPLDGSVLLLATFTFKGDTTSKLNLFYNLQNQLTTFINDGVMSVYDPDSDTTSYIIQNSDPQVVSTDSLASFAVFTTDDTYSVDTGPYNPNVVYRFNLMFAQASQATVNNLINNVNNNYIKRTDIVVDSSPIENSPNFVMSGGVYNFVDQRVEKYYDDLPVTKTFSDLVVGDDLSGMAVSFPDPIDMTNSTGSSTNSHLVDFTNGYYINLSVNTVQTPAYFRLIDTNGQAAQNFYSNSKTPVVSSYTFPDGFIISNINRDEITQYYGGSWQTQLVFNGQVQGEITIKWLYDQIIAMKAQLDQTTTDLTNHVLHDADLYQAILIAAREEAQAIYDGTDVPLSTTGTPVIGTGGVLALGSDAQYVVPENGGITITFSAVLALGNVQVLVNGNSVFDSSAISLLSVPAPTTVRVNGGDIVTTSGSLGLLSSLSVVFYPNKPI